MNGKRLLLIINPCAGRNKKRVGTLEILNKLSCADYDFNIKTTRCQGDATTIAKENGNDYDIIVCCGGDGTLNETINGVMKLNKRVPVGYIPAGSTNDLASTLGIPVGVGEATDLILSGKTNGYDLGSFNGKYFCYVASFGIATDISYNTPQKMKNLFGHSAYVINGFILRLIPMLMNFKPIHMKVEYDEGEIEDDFYFGSLSNSTSVAGLFKFNKQEVKLNDGYFELLLVKGLKSNLDAFSMLNKVVHQEYDGKQILLLRTKKVKITSEKKVPWTLDGEFGGEQDKVEMEVVHNAFDIYSDNDEMFVSRDTSENNE
jgi:diacylglycerol kinase (ATP)